MYKHLVQTVDNIMSAWLIKLNDRDKNYYEKGDDYADATDQNVNDSVYDADDYYNGDGDSDGNAADHNDNDYVDGVRTMMIPMMLMVIVSIR